MRVSPRPLTGLFAGIAAGVAAAALIRAVRPRGARGSAPAASGSGGLAPLAVGAAVGGAYGLLSEYRPETRADFGAAYGIAAALLLEDAMPGDGAAALTPAAPLADMIGSAAAHLAYGAVLEGVRALLAARR